MKIDLHAHSNCSDGKESVEEVFRQAKLAGVDVLALTDHDTTHGWPLAAAAAKAEGIGFVPGWFIKLVALALIWAYLHHFIAGIRHIMMDVNHAAVTKQSGASSAKRTKRKLFSARSV